MPLDQASAAKILDADISNIIRKARDGKTLSSSEWARVSEAARTGEVERPKWVGKPPKRKIDLAKILGITKEALNRHVHKPDAPAIGDVDGWFEFLAAHGRSGTSSQELRSEVAAERLRLAKWQADRAEREERVARGELVPRGTVLAGLKEGVGHLFAVLDRVLCNEMPPSIEGLDVLQIRLRVAAELERAKSELTGVLNRSIAQTAAHVELHDPETEKRRTDEPAKKRRRKRRPGADKAKPDPGGA